MRNASLASMISPVRIKRIARPMPMSLGRFLAPPLSGTNPAGTATSPKAGAIRSDSHIAQGSHLQADADRRSIDGGDCDLRQIFELAHRALQDSDGVGR